jgi:pyruvate,water dikinase
LLFDRPVNQAAERYALPIRLETHLVNGYLYFNYCPVGAPPDGVAKGLHLLGRWAPRLVQWLIDRHANHLAQEYLTRLTPVMARLTDLWREQWLPDLQQLLAEWEAFDLAQATQDELAAHFAASLRRLERAYEIHMQLIAPAYLALHLFTEFYQTLFPQDDEFAAYRLLQGSDNSFLQANRALWQLSRQARTMPTVNTVLTTYPPDQVVARLAASPIGQVFLAALQSFLQQFGQRGHHTFALSEPSWIEDPTPVIAQLQSAIAQADRDLETEWQVEVAVREEAIAQTRQRLSHQSQPVCEKFERLLAAAQVATYLHEEHNFWIDQRCQYQMRRVVLAVGQRLVAAQLLVMPADLFYLTLTEVRQLLTSQTALGVPVSALVQQRRGALRQAATLTPPPAIGRLLLLPTPNDPFLRTFTKLLGASPIPTAAELLAWLPPAQQASNRESVIAGQAASPGVVRGRARVIRTLAEANQLQQGDILVTEATMPPWTPYFSLVAAIVTDTGGILSHAAVVAREVGIPAVVGTRVATATITDGQVIEVDGGAGVVRVVG